MNAVFTIGKLESLTKVPAKTIRFYESIGLIEKARRAPNGYRTYTKQAVTELHIIKYARDLGLPINEIKRLMKGCDHGDCAHSKQYLEREIDGYTGLLDQKIRQLSLLKTKLHTLRSSLGTDKCADSHSYCCNILGQLADSLKGGEA